MKITDIDFIENKFLFKITIDDEISYLISYDTYEKYQLKKELEIDEQLYNFLIKEDSFNIAKSKAINFCNYKMRSESEVRKKLYTLKTDDKVIDKVISYLKEKAYINDETYSREYFNQCLKYKRYSLLRTRQKLIEKGIKKNIIEELISREDIGNIEYENALYNAEKKSRLKDLEDAKEYQKIYMYLVRNGFSYEMSRSVMEELKNDKNK